MDDDNTMPPTPRFLRFRTAHPRLPQFIERSKPVQPVTQASSAD
jgi:hypothetical protein